MADKVTHARHSDKKVVFARVDRSLAEYLHVVAAWKGLKRQDVVALALTEWLDKFRQEIPSP